MKETLDKLEMGKKYSSQKLEEMGFKQTGVTPKKNYRFYERVYDTGRISIATTGGNLIYINFIINDDIK